MPLPAGKIVNIGQFQQRVRTKFLHEKSKSPPEKSPPRQFKSREERARVNTRGSIDLAQIYEIKQLQRHNQMQQLQVNQDIGVLSNATRNRPSQDDNTVVHEKSRLMTPKNHETQIVKLQRKQEEILDKSPISHDSDSKLMEFRIEEAKPITTYSSCLLYTSPSPRDRG